MSSSSVGLYRSASTAAPTIRESTRTGSGLPQPPTDAELYLYLGPQRRWVLLLCTVSYAVATISLGLFSIRHPALWVFLLPFAIGTIATILNGVDGQKQRQVTRLGHELLVRSWRPANPPSVDIFLPTCGEPLEVLANTYWYVRNLQWTGHLRVLVLDDSARPQVQRLARAFGFDYGTRPDLGRYKKSGNLNFGLKNSDGDLVVILDADFCPRADFLLHLAPYFEDPTVGIVQSPQYFDTDTSMGWLQRASGATQEQFYRWIQPARDAEGAAVCVGSNAMYRRSALATIGGFTQLDHSEDIFTGIQLTQQGHRLRYVPVILAKGLSPETTAAFISQQYRWCMGSMSLLFSRSFHRSGLHWRQRLCFWQGFIGYITSAMNAFVAPLPGIVMMLAFPKEIHPWQILPFVGLLWVWLVLIPTTYKGRWRFEVMRVHTLFAYCHALAILHAMLGRNANWVPTGVSGSSTLVRTVSRLTFGWLVITTGAAWASLGYDIVAFGWSRYWALSIFLGGTGYLVLPILAAVWPTLRSKRRSTAMRVRSVQA